MLRISYQHLVLFIYYRMMTIYNLYTYDIHQHQSFSETKIINGIFN